MRELASLRELSRDPLFLTTIPYGEGQGLVRKSDSLFRAVPIMHSLGHHFDDPTANLSVLLSQVGGLTTKALTFEPQDQEDEFLYRKRAEAVRAGSLPQESLPIAWLAALHWSSSSRWSRFDWSAPCEPKGVFIHSLALISSARDTLMAGLVPNLDAEFSDLGYRFWGTNAPNLTERAFEGSFQPLESLPEERRPALPRWALYREDEHPGVVRFLDKPALAA